MSAPKILFGRKRRIDVYQPYARSAVSIDQLAFLFHLHKTLQRLQIVAEDQHVPPAIRLCAEGAHRLQRYRQGVGQDVLLPFLAVVYQLVLAFLRREKLAAAHSAGRSSPRRSLSITIWRNSSFMDSS